MEQGQNRREKKIIVLLLNKHMELHHKVSFEPTLSVLLPPALYRDAPRLFSLGFILRLSKHFLHTFTSSLLLNNLWFFAFMTECSNVFIGMLLVPSWNISLKQYSHDPCTPNP